MNKGILLLTTLLAFMLAVTEASAALSVTVTQSGADSDEVMKGRTFTIGASGWTGDCTTATLSFSGCSSCALSGENLVKTVGQSSSISWTTASASQSATAQTVSVTLSGGCTAENADGSSFDIVLPPSLTLDATTGASTVNKGSSFEVNLEVTNDGETTAQALTIDPTTSGFTSDCSSISSLDEQQSAAQTCNVAAASSLTGGSKTVTLEVSSTNADSATDTVSITVNAASGDGICDPGETGTSDCESGGNGGDGGPGGGAGGTPVLNRTSRPTLVPGAGLRNNTMLQAAIEKVLAMGEMSEQAKENLLRLSASITSDVSSTHEFNVVAGKSRIQNTITYSGQKKVTNFMVFDSLPKTFARNASMVTVTAPGGTVEIAEEDPSWLILFPEVDPGQELTVTYEVTGQKSTTVLDGMVTEVYAESLEVPAELDEEVPGDGAVETPGTPTGPAGEAPPPVIDPLIVGGIVAVVVVVAVVVLVLKSRKKGKAKPVTALRAVESNFKK